ncbi:SET domain-containing protein 5 [Cladorrhinum sp. PSN332]|nr:SET domain-containing protein 5 [Cladorrhinum sp. PSN332]
MYLLEPLFLASLSLIVGLAHGRDKPLGHEKCLQPLIPEHQEICPSPLSSRREKPTLPKIINNNNNSNQKPLQNINRDEFKLDDEDEYQLPPSWQGPAHCVGEFCMYWNTEIDDGIVLISTARNAWLTANFPIPRSPQVEPTAFYQKQLPGKGVGLIANRTIRKGEIIMERVPTLLIQSKPHVTLDPEIREKLYEAALERLSDSVAQKFMGQYGETVTKKVDKNAFRMVIDGKAKYSDHFSVFPDVSRMNHDCRPNVHYRLTDLTHTTIAVRDIHPGEELTVSYIYGQHVRAERQKQLKETWGFDCACSQCTLPELESMASDARVREIRRLEKEIEDKMATNNGRDVKPEMGGRLVKLYLDERLEAYMAPTYTRAALIYSMFGNEEKALEYAREAVAALDRELGSEAGDVVSMREMLDDLKGHWSWRIKVPPPSPSPSAGAAKKEGKSKQKGTVRRTPGAGKEKPGK